MDMISEGAQPTKVILYTLFIPPKGWVGLWSSRRYKLWRCFLLHYAAEHHWPARTGVSRCQSWYAPPLGRALYFTMLILYQDISQDGTVTLLTVTIV